MEKIADLQIHQSVLHPTETQSSRVTHHYGPEIIIGEVGPDYISNRQTEIDSKADSLDYTGLLGLKAFQLRQSDAFKEAKLARPHEGVSWQNDIAGLEAPGTPEKAGGVTGLVDGPTSSQLSGKVAVSIVIVSGPGDLAFTEDEITKVIAEVQNGLSWLGTQTGTPVSFYYNIPATVQLTLPDDPNGTNKEAYWLNPTMSALGFPNVYDFVNNVRSELDTQWTYCGFFVKYSQSWFAYTNSLGGPYICMQYANDGWGPDNIDRVFAHESGHVFNAPDEYSGAWSCSCTSAFGIYHVPNFNCQSCAPGGGVDCIMKGNSWTMCCWTPWHVGCKTPARLWDTNDIQQGSGAIGWLTGDINHDGKKEIVQLWANGSSLGMIAYGWVNGAMSTIWSSSNMGEGSGALQWLIGDVNHDGKDEVVQLWANGSSLGMIVYGWVNGAMSVLWSSNNMGEGPDAVQWLIGDVNNDGQKEIIQLWANGSSLGMIVYGWVSGAMSVLWSSSNMGEGPDAAQWLIGDVNHDGQAEVVQLWANGSSLAMIVYGWVNGAMSVLWSSSNMGEGPGAVQWLIGDVNNDGQKEIVQLWANGSSLGMIVYGWVNGAMSTIWSSSDMGEGPGAVGWLIGDVDKDGKDEIIQLWDNGSLGLIEYSWVNGAMTTHYSNGNMSEGPGALAWVMGDVTGQGYANIIQPWANGTTLGMIVYGYFQ